MTKKIFQTQHFDETMINDKKVFCQKFKQILTELQQKKNDYRDLQQKFVNMERLKGQLEIQN